MQVEVANNYYKGITINPGSMVFYFFSQNSNITILNETIVDNTLDDLYTVGNANNVLIKDIWVKNNTGTGSITETSAIMRVSEANGNCIITNYTVTNSSFVYGKAIEVDAVKNLHMYNSVFSFNHLQNQDFIMFN
jgi:hypothetical protein